MKKENVSGFKNCNCNSKNHDTKLIVLTGGPCAGKTAILELAQKVFCKHTVFIPEAATIVYGGGFWRLDSPACIKAAQKTICFIQKELESLVQKDSEYSLAVCDRGIIDSIAYWPSSEIDFWSHVERSREEVYKHYHTVIHLKTPTTEKMGYNFDNPVRNETVQEAKALDDKTLAVWEGHPNRHIVEPTEDFMDKANQVFDILKKELASCCR